MVSLSYFSSGSNLRFGPGTQANTTMRIRAQKDFWSGVMFLAFAAVAMIAASGYAMGSGGRMGPGYFPLLLGGVLALLGAILVARSLIIDGEHRGRLNLAPLLVIAAGVVLFGLSIERLGLVISLVAATIVSALASRESRPVEVALLAAVLAAFSVSVFVYALRLPLPIWPQL
jgi:putative tricarboxylic transport membrane protein